ncbi:MAG: glycosyltransferase family 2 protein [Burkholderiaceae bacterium]|jgi:cellulose synthase/poly-beta-1,6-N-acetylglucosamine synthase-like glycosyltransferase|nr:glycosyltransferase family 2 protein [Burkholderiales bacterium]MCZ8108157.1 glycosyltransferase family 2 protein [Burkholderiales bacterium]MCZ8337306.1 glycosyltransferase family 2 protein [Burkholderiaceae bacterium]
MSIATLAFWLAVAFVAYTYVGYPLIVRLLAGRGDEPAPPQPASWPSVTVVVAVHDEASRIPRKLESLRAQDYPGLVTLLFVSDGSTDGTEALLRTQPDVRTFAYAPRRGKPAALNAAMAEVDTELVVFTDVRQPLEASAIRRLVARLLQPGVGAVSGELIHVEPGNRVAASVGLYWRYEKAIRKAESRIASTVGVTGALYCIRSADFEPLAPDTLLDDLIVPMRIARRGKRVLLEPGAILYDELQTETAGERKRKVRTLTGNFQAIASEPWLLSPTANPLFVQFVSHKLFRLFVPYAIVVAFVAALAADGAFYHAMAAIQAALLLGALGGLASARLRAQRLFGFLAVFAELNFAAVLALREFVAGRMDARWEKT